MPFNSFKELMEHEAAARQKYLEDCPEGSINHQLSKLPVQIREWPEGFIVRLPRTGLIVVPYANDGSWKCLVVKGDETYKVGGYHLSVSQDEIERGERIEL